jgi:hypothetical protein
MATPATSTNAQHAIASDHLLGPGGFFGAWLNTHVLDVLHAHPLWFALIVVAILYVLYGTLTRQWNVWRLATGADGKLSTSKFQFLVWTCAVIYVAVALVFAHRGQVAFLSKLPQNLFIVMGFSLATAVGAKYVAVKSPTATPVDPNPVITMNPLFLIADNDGRLDLNKAQMLAWTFVAIGAFCYDFLGNYGDYLRCTPQCLPDVPEALMVLMGLGQGAYLGGKVISTSGGSS